MSKKKGEYSVLSEVNTEEEWLSLCSKEGLTVVDVYSEWSGPCNAMTGFLKKMKVEINDDLLNFAMAKTDQIPQLKHFQGQCKPIWLFIASGSPVAVVHGANAPLLGKMIQNEIYKERMALIGERDRNVINLKDAVPKRNKAGGDNDNAAGHKFDGVDENVYQCLKELKEQDEKMKVQEQSKNFTLLLIEEYIKEDEENIAFIVSILSNSGFTVMRRKGIVLQQDDAAIFAAGNRLETQHISAMIGTNCMVMLLRCDESLRAISRIEELLGPLDTSNPEEGTPPAQYVHLFIQ